MVVGGLVWLLYILGLHRSPPRYLEGSSGTLPCSRSAMPLCLLGYTVK